MFLLAGVIVQSFQEGRTQNPAVSRHELRCYKYKGKWVGGLGTLQEP